MSLSRAGCTLEGHRNSSASQMAGGLHTIYLHGRGEGCSARVRGSVTGPLLSQSGRYDPIVDRCLQLIEANCGQLNVAQLRTTAIMLGQLPDGAREAS